MNWPALFFIYNTENLLTSKNKQFFKAKNGKKLDNKGMLFELVVR